MLINSFIDFNLIRDNNIDAVIYYYPLYVVRRSALTISGRPYTTDLRKSYHQKIEINTTNAKYFLLSLENIVLQKHEFQGINEGDIRICVDFYINNDIIFTYGIGFDKSYIFINELWVENDGMFYNFINNYININ